MEYVRTMATKCLLCISKTLGTFLIVRKGTVNLKMLILSFIHLHYVPNLYGFLSI